jgi:hypothetical protein
VRLLYSLLFNFKCKDRGTLCGVAFDILAYMTAIESLLLCNSHKIPLSTSMLINGTRYNGKEWNPLSS